MKSTLFRTVLGLAVVSLITFAVPAAALALEFTERVNMSNNPGINDRWVSVSGDLAVFTAHPVPDEIHLYDFGTQQKTVLVKNEYHNGSPHISGNFIVYSSYRDGTRGIYLCEYSAETGTCPEVPIVTGLRIASGPYIKGNHIVWVERVNTGDPVDLKYCEYDPQQHLCGNYQTLAANLYFLTHPIILDDEDTVLWNEGNATFSDDIYGVSISAPGVVHQVLVDDEKEIKHLEESDGIVVFQSGLPGIRDYTYPEVEYCEFDPLNMTCVNRTSIANGVPIGIDMVPTISGNYIVYANLEDIQNYFSEGTIFLYDIETGETTVVTASDDINQGFPVIDGNTIVMEEHYAAQGGDIYTEQVYVEILSGDEGDPTEITLDPVGDITAVVGETINLTLSASTDVPAEIVMSHSFPSGTVEGVSFSDNGDGTASFSWTPAESQVGTQYIHFTATSGEVSDSELVTFTITAAPEPPAVNLIENGSFEEGKASWNGWALKKQLTTETAYDGATSVEMTLKPGGLLKLNQLDKDIVPGTNYNLSAAVKTDGIGAAEAYVEVEWRKAGGGLIRVDSFAQTSGTTDWAVYSSGVLTAPEDAAKVKVFLIGPKGEGYVYFDAISMYEN